VANHFQGRKRDIKISIQRCPGAKADIC
jgi:hypothetical protein